MEMFVQQIVNGIMVASLYALVAIPLTTIYAVLRVLQLAHGELIVIGGYVGLVCLLWCNNIFLALLITIIAVVGLSIILERLTFYQLRRRNAGDLEGFLVAIALVLFLTETANRLFYGGIPVAYPITGGTSYQLGEVAITSMQLLLLGVCLVSAGTLEFFIRHTKLGKALQCVAIDPQIASILGVSINRAASLVFAIGGLSAAIAGILYGLTYGYMATAVAAGIGFKGFVVVLLAGAGNVVGALGAAAFLGLVEALATGYLASTFRDAFAYGAIILVLILRPTGLFGTRY